MSTRVLRKSRDPLELLERALNKTALTTKRLTHTNILGIGDPILSQIYVDHEAEKQKAVKEALEAAEARATRELKAALHRLQQQKEEEKRRALVKQKQYYEDLAKRVAEQRDRAEAERIRELTLKFEKDKEEALRKQWEEAERLKVKAIEEACVALRKQLRQEFILEKEKAIANALAKAREKFKIREREAIERTKRECEAIAAAEAARVAELHAQEIKQHEKRYSILDQKYRTELKHSQRVENDFRELQTDYSRFMDYTDGQYHSDYMMYLRSHGQRLAGKRISVVTYDDIEELPDIK